MAVKRQAIVINFDDSFNVDAFDKTIFNVYYISKKLRYCIVYFDCEKYDAVKHILSRMCGIKSYNDSLFEVEKIVF